MMKLSQMIKPELDYLRANLNLTEEETKIFNLLATDKSVTYIASVLCVTDRTVYRRKKEIEEKIKRLEKYRQTT